VTIRELSINTDGEPSQSILERVTTARHVQALRFKGKHFNTNSQIAARSVKKYCAINDTAKELLEQAVEKYALSARAYHRILKVSRTIADLDGNTDIEEQHVAEAVQYRVLDKRL
jgi:magnesium chelatase family protein